MLSFLEFLLESTGGCTYLYSPEFRNILKRIRDGKFRPTSSVVATYLLDHENSTKMGDMTFIDITDKNDKISFLQCNRVDKFYDSDKDNNDYLNKDQWMLLQRNKLYKGERSDVWKNQRIEIGIGKFVNKVVSLDSETNLTPKIVEDFVNSYKSAFDSKDDKLEDFFEVVSGEDIRKWYLDDNYESISGQLGNSCMRYKKCQSFLDIYVHNPESVSLLILKSSSIKDKIVGRCLIWNTIDGLKYDRIYTIKDSDIITFENYFEGEEIKDVSSGDNWVELKKVDFDYYPYMDNMMFLDIDSKTLTNDDTTFPDDNIWRLRETDGGVLKNVVWSDYHDEYISKDDSVYINSRDTWVREDSAVYLEYRDEWFINDSSINICSRTGEYIHSDDSVYSMDLDGSILRDDSVEYYYYSNDGIRKSYTHIDFKKDLIEIEYKGKKILTYRHLLHKIYGDWEFKLDKKFLSDLVDRYNMVSEDELKSYVMSLDINLDFLKDESPSYKYEYKKLNELLSEIGEESFKKFIKLSILYAIPTKYNRSSNNMYSGFSYKHYFVRMSDVEYSDEFGLIDVDIDLIKNYMTHKMNRLLESLAFDLLKNNLNVLATWIDKHFNF